MGTHLNKSQVFMLLIEETLSLLCSGLVWQLGLVSQTKLSHSFKVNLRFYETKYCLGAKIGSVKLRFGEPMNLVKLGIQKKTCS